MPPETTTDLAVTESHDLEPSDARLQPISTAKEMLAVVGLTAIVPIVLANVLGPSVGMTMIWVVFGLAIVLALRRNRKWQQTVKLSRELNAALERDDIATATRLGRSLVSDSPRMGLARVLAIAHWAVVELHRGHPRRTIELDQRALGSSQARGRMGTMLEIWRVRGALALAHAIVDEREDARRELTRAEQDAGPSHRGALFNVRMFLLLRDGEPSAALRHFDAEFRDAEPLVHVSGSRVARMLEAFALEQLGGDDYRSTSVERQDRALERAREARRGAFDHLAVQWPELAEFLSRHGLAG